MALLQTKQKNTTQIDVTPKGQQMKMCGTVGNGMEQQVIDNALQLDLAHVKSDNY